MIQTFFRIDDLIFTKEGQKEIKFLKGCRDDECNYLIFFNNFIKLDSLAGCTANVALFYGDMLYVANLGDSRAVLCRDNNAIDMSYDHKPDNPNELTRIKKAGGYV